MVRTGIRDGLRISRCLSPAAVDEPIRITAFRTQVGRSTCPTMKWTTSTREIRPFRHDGGSVRTL